MRKFTLFIASLFLAVGAMAQYGSKMVYVTDLSQLSNDKVYTLESERPKLPLQYKSVWRYFFLDP